MVFFKTSERRSDVTVSQKVQRRTFLTGDILLSNLTFHAKELQQLCMYLRETTFLLAVLREKMFFGQKSKFCPKIRENFLYV